MNTKNIIIAALLATNLAGIGVVSHYKHQAKENQQDFWQSSAEFDRLKEEYDADLKAGCQDLVDSEIKKLEDEIESCDDMVSDEQAEIDDLASVPVRSLKPEIFKGNQAASYSFASKIKKGGEVKNYFYVILALILFLLVCRIEDPKDYMTKEELVEYELQNKKEINLAVNKGD